MKCNSGCPKSCLGNLPPALGTVIPNPVKDLLEGLGNDPHEYYHSVLDGFPGLPKLEDFQKMIEGRKPMPLCLELYIFRKCYCSYGHLWKLAGGPVG